MTPPKCSCGEPREHVDPRRKGWCGNCLRQLDPRWLSTDKTVSYFFDRLANGVFPKGRTDHYFADFRAICEARERKGRDEFGLGYLTRPNLREAGEEEADACMYRHLEMLKRFMQEGDDEGLSLVLQASMRSFEAFRLDREAEARLKGAP